MLQLLEEKEIGDLQMSIRASKPSRDSMDPEVCHVSLRKDKHNILPK